MTVLRSIRPWRFGFRMPRPRRGAGLPWLALAWLVIVAFCVAFGPLIAEGPATKMQLDALNSAFVKTARSKGAPEGRVIYVHALRNAFIPISTVAGDQAVAIANGAVIVETVFGWPGIGRVMIESVQQRDFAVVQAVILIVAITVFAINFLIDFLYTILDPRVRL